MGSNIRILSSATVDVTATLISNNRRLASLVQVTPQVDIECWEEDKSLDVAQEELAKEIPITAFPPWVQPSYVKRIKELKCYELVREMLLAGVPVMEIGRKIQSLGELTKLKLVTIETMINHYRQTIPAWVVAARQQPKQFLEVKQRADQTIDVMAKLANLYELIESRIQIGIAQDKKFQLVTGNLSREFQVASDILMRIQEMKERLGFGPGAERVALPTSPAQSLDWSRVYARESVAKVMGDPDSRSRVVAVAERLIDLYGKKLSLPQIEQIRKSREVVAEREEPIQE